MSEQRIVCEVCHQEQKSPKGLGQHVRNQHGLSAQEYYDQYLKADDAEGICPICGKPTKFVSIQRGYQPFCGARCANRSEEKRSAIRQHIAERTDEQREEIKKKCRSTRLEHYGDENYGLYGSDSFKKTMLERYGDEHYNNIEKNMETNRRNHGGVLNLQTPEFREQARQTKLERYGADHDMEKTRETCRQRYGADYAYLTPDVRSKINRTKRKKTVANFAQALKAQQITLLEDTPEGLVCTCDQCGRDIFIAQYCVYAKIKRGDICRYCHPRQFSYDSQLQRDIATFISEQTNVPVLYDDRQAIWPQELDIYIPDLHIAFEVDGMYWHSTEYKSPSYHLDKTLLCEERGITLYHVFECEWLSKRPIVESRIRSILGAYDRRLYARQLDVRVVPRDDDKAFFAENHLQGPARSTVTYGLYDGDELVMAMSFGRPRFSKKYDWEVIRLASKLGTQVVGGAARLLAAFEREHAGEGRLVSYADLRWSRGSIYESLGFERVGTSRPDYWYFRDADLMVHRSAYQKHKLPDLLDEFDPEMTEQENMIANGFFIIYDCGNAVYVKEF